MGLGEHSITSWDEMRKIFIRKYPAYCRSKDLKDEIFRMSQQEDESLEEYLEIFSYNLQKSKYNSLTPEMIRTIFLKGIREEYLDILNVMGKGDISYLPFNEIQDLCQNYSRGKATTGRRDVTTKVTKSATSGISRAELGNLLEDFNTDLLSTLGTQVETLKTKKRQEQ